MYLAAIFGGILATGFSLLFLPAYVINKPLRLLSSAQYFLPLADDEVVAEGLGIIF
jgi:hypothetical protein